MSVYQDFKSIANQIVGYWYHKQEDQTLIFSLNEKIGHYADLCIISKEKITKTIYAIGIEPSITIEEAKKEKWYFDTGYPDFGGRRPVYYIEAISENELTLRQAGGQSFTYIRKIDEDFVNETLKGLN